MLCLRIFVLFTLRTVLNAIVCCLQLNTGRGADANPKVDFLGIDACWIAVYVLCRNALSKSHISHHDMYVHCYALSICQLPNCNFTTRKVLIDNVSKSSAKGYFSSPMGLTRRYGFCC